VGGRLRKPCVKQEAKSTRPEATDKIVQVPSPSSYGDLPVPSSMSSLQKHKCPLHLRFTLVTLQYSCSFFSSGSFIWGCLMFLLVMCLKSECGTLVSCIILSMCHLHYHKHSLSYHLEELCTSGRVF